MRIVRYHELGSPSVLRLMSTPAPEPGPGEVLIKAEAIGVTLAEVQRRQGIPIGGPVELPGAPGGDVAGTIAALGPEVTGFHVGDRVVADIAQGAYADLVVSPADMLLPIPDGMAAGQATLLPTSAQTAYHVIKASGQLRPGEMVLVDAAAGGVGHLAVQIAKAMGAGLVIATAAGPEKVEFVRSLGADHAFDYTNNDWPDRVRAVTDGSGVDLVLETVGGDILSRSIELVAQFGRLVFYGSASGADLPDVNPMYLFGMKTITGFSIHAMLHSRREEMQAGWRDLLEMISTGAITPVVSAALPLEEAAKSHEIMEARATLGRIVLTP